MNCEKYQDLLSDFIDGSLTHESCDELELHLAACEGCSDARSDLQVILKFCHEQRGAYDAVPNERALWLRISNTIESEAVPPSRPAAPATEGRWSRLMRHRWQLSFPQIAASAAALVILVALVTVMGLRGFKPANGGTDQSLSANSMSLTDRYRQRQQAIEYWNQRVELNKLRWNPQMRETFERNLGVIDAAVNDSMQRLKTNPHDELSEEILNTAMSDKLELLKEFAEL